MSNNKQRFGTKKKEKRLCVTYDVFLLQLPR
jgi:hypothetical protein